MNTDQLQTYYVRLIRKRTSTQLWAILTRVPPMGKHQRWLIFQHRLRCSYPDFDMKFMTTVKPSNLG
jgi:hypothetical protein